jgi:hypothetical protein
MGLYILLRTARLESNRKYGMLLMTLVKNWILKIAEKLQSYAGIYRRSLKTLPEVRTAIIYRLVPRHRVPIALLPNSLVALFCR